jgi:hypothetical protein
MQMEMCILESGGMTNLMREGHNDICQAYICEGEW